MLTNRIEPNAQTTGSRRARWSLCVLAAVLTGAWTGAGWAATSATSAVSPGLKAAIEGVELCSPEWVKPRMDDALEEFTTATSDVWERLQRSGQNAAGRGELGLVEQATILLDLGQVLGSFKDSPSMVDLEQLSETCDDPGLVSNALIATLEDAGVPADYIGLMREFEGFMELIVERADALPQPVPQPGTP